MRIVGEAADGEEALAIAHRERPDLVVTDLTMPRLNGIELTRHIRQELPRTMVRKIVRSWRDEMPSGVNLHQSRGTPLHSFAGFEAWGRGRALGGRYSAEMSE